MRAKRLSAQSEFIFGTLCTINLFEAGSQELYTKVFARLRELDKIFNTNNPLSEISILNQNAGIGFIKVSNELFFVVQSALDFSKKTGGAFDITLGTLINLWGINTQSPKVPSKDEIENAKHFTGYKKVHLNDAEKSIYIEQPGVLLDLGGIAKGYATDCIVKILKEQKVTRALIDLGGNIYAFGNKVNGDAWTVGIKNPFDTGAKPIFTIKTSDRAVVTSGNYERFFINDGVRYHHIFDSSTGYPAQSGIASVTIVCASSMQADALSTSIFIMGKNGVYKLKQLGYVFECIIIDEKGNVWKD